MLWQIIGFISKYFVKLNFRVRIVKNNADQKAVDRLPPAASNLFIK